MNIRKKSNPSTSLQSWLWQFKIQIFVRMRDNTEPQLAPSLKENFLWFDWFHRICVMYCFLLSYVSDLQDEILKKTQKTDSNLDKTRSKKPEKYCNLSQFFYIFSGTNTRKPQSTFIERFSLIASDPRPGFQQG